MKSGKFYLLLAVGIVAACLVAAQSYAIVHSRRAPTLSLALSVAPEGLAKASLSRALQGARLAKDPKSAPPKLEVQLAREGFSADPLAVAALPVLIQNLQAKGQVQQSRRLLELAGGLTRRDNLINAMLIDEAMLKDDPKRAVELLGRAMAVSYEVRYLYVRRMAAATASAGALQALPPILGANPKWAEDYWQAVLENPSIMPMAGDVRQRIADEPWKLNQPNEKDLQLIHELGIRGYPAAAFGLSQALGLKASPTGELITNGSFDRAPRFVPIDWELLQTGDIGATIEPKEKALLLSSLPAASGTAARQIVQLSGPGRYRVGWTMTGLAKGSDAVVKLRLNCADPTKMSPSIAPAVLGDGTGSASITVPATACQWYWASLELDTSRGDTGVDIAIRRLSLRREAAAANAVATAAERP